MHPDQLQQTPTKEDYDKQFEAKLCRLESLLAKHFSKTFDLHTSTPSHYRMRAEFRVWHDDDELNYVMFPKGESKSPVVIHQYVPGSQRMQQLMPLLMEAIRGQAILRRRLFQIDFLTTTTGACLLSLLYHRKLDDDWLRQAQRLEQQLDVSIIGRSRKQKIMCSTDHVLESVQVAGKTLHYQQYENSFTQPNAGINQQMLNWAHQQTLNGQGDLLELYCGNGNFSIALATNFRQVLATEVDKFGIKAAQYNCDKNSLNNVQLVRMSAADVASALSAERKFRRMAAIDLESYQFSTVLVDPPRAGLDHKALEFVRGFDRIIYISCNPASLEENLAALNSSHSVTAAAMFDQFPFTEHIESGVVLQRI